ncbi:short coiled-coil protein B isoform X1 [Brienomyrus brachyistius]|uniref:short coiled-coil protein B isoform X1 n=2 Tax=Mormyridae TaxID=31092 RepID=UPI0020B3CE03|nr:short coiled-coil protein B isoform X1 [Brienomyrus brachyistius]
MQRKARRRWERRREHGHARSRRGKHPVNMEAEADEEEDDTFTTISLADDSGENRTTVLHLKEEEEEVCFSVKSKMDGDVENQVEVEEKTRLINQVLELQHTLEDLSARVDAVKEENLKLKSENQVLGQYIENLMSASSVFQTTDTKGKRK